MRSGRFSVSFSLDYLTGFLFTFDFLSFSLCMLKSAEYLFSGAPETLANHLLLTRSASPPELYVCLLGCFVCLDPPSMKQRHKYSLPYRTLLFFYLLKRTFLLCFTSNISFSFFRHHNILNKPDGPFGCLDI